VSRRRPDDEIDLAYPPTSSPPAVTGLRPERRRGSACAPPLIPPRPRPPAATRKPASPSGDGAEDPSLRTTAPLLAYLVQGHADRGAHRPRELREDERTRTLRSEREGNRCPERGRRCCASRTPRNRGCPCLHGRTYVVGVDVPGRTRGWSPRGAEPR
jgi:hypothetical protein